MQWVWKIGVLKNKKQKRANFKDKDFVGEIENDGKRVPEKKSKENIYAFMI